MPMPYSCYMVAYPLSFDLLESSDLVEEPVAAVKSRSFLPFDQIIPALKNEVQIGDILVKIDGMTLKEYYEANKHVTGGANEFGGLRSALNHFQMRPGAM